MSSFAFLLDNGLDALVASFQNDLPNPITDVQYTRKWFQGPQDLLVTGLGVTTRFIQNLERPSGILQASEFAVPAPANIDFVYYGNLHCRYVANGPTLTPGNDFSFLITLPQKNGTAANFFTNRVQADYISGGAIDQSTSYLTDTSVMPNQLGWPPVMFSSLGFETVAPETLFGRLYWFFDGLRIATKYPNS